MEKMLDIHDVKTLWGVSLGTAYKWTHPDTGFPKAGLFATRNGKLRRMWPIKKIAGYFGTTPTIFLRRTLRAIPPNIGSI